MSYKKSNKGNKEKRGPTLGVCCTEVSVFIIEVSVKREWTVQQTKRSDNVLWSLARGLKQWNFNKPSALKSDHGRIQEVVVYERF